MGNKLICFVGMAGAGKSEASDYFMSLGEFEYIRFGQVVLDKVKESNLPHSESLEREIREQIRKEHGMAAMAVLNLVKIEEKLRKKNVIADGLYSWEEYTFLKDKFAGNLIVVSIYASPRIRYERLTGRHLRHDADDDLRFRSFSEDQAESRDKAEIENLHKAGPIAMADYCAVNVTDFDELKNQLDSIYRSIFITK